MLNAKNIPVLGFCAHSSGIGKTTLLTQLIPALIQQGLRISVVKHAHHEFDIDHEGKDSFKLRQAGAVQMMVASRQRWALMTELVRTPHAENESLYLAFKYLAQKCQYEAYQDVLSPDCSSEGTDKYQPFTTSRRNLFFTRRSLCTRLISDALIATIPLS